MFSTMAHAYMTLQCSSGSMSDTKKGQLYMKVKQVDGSEKMHMLWPVRYCAKAGVNCIFLTCKLSQGNRISSDNKNSIVVQKINGNNVLNFQIKTHNCCISRVMLLCDSKSKKVNVQSHLLN